MHFSRELDWQLEQQELEELQVVVEPIIPQTSPMCVIFEGWCWANYGSYHLLWNIMEYPVRLIYGINPRLAKSAPLG